MKAILFFVILLITTQNANCTMYECTYENNKKVVVTSSFNSLIKEVTIEKIEYPYSIGK